MVDREDKVGGVVRKGWNVNPDIYISNYICLYIEKGTSCANPVSVWCSMVV